MFEKLPENLWPEAPKRFDYPFYYTPKKLALVAAEKLMLELEDHKIRHNFNRVGKMFGVLVCRDQNGKIGFLKAYSGVLESDELPFGFVPHLYDMLPNIEDIENEKKLINEMTSQIQELEKNNHADKILFFEAKIISMEEEIKKIKLKAKENKIKRNKLREDSRSNLSEDSYRELEKKLIKESLFDKYHLNLEVEACKKKIIEYTTEKEKLSNPLRQLKEKRKRNSHELHELIYKSYEFLNIKGEKKSLFSIFQEELNRLPPAGSGDCALPKLLQYAFRNKLTPLSFCEFWWGAPHKSEIRKHKNFYHACTGKCKPILNHMLSGIECDHNPMLEDRADKFKIEVIFEDNDFIIINKPSGLLSVPGKELKDSVYLRIKGSYPSIEGPIIVHRLDQDTSGLMILPKNEYSYKEIQSQFIKRTINKRYTALLQGEVTEISGEIRLPLRVDLNNRPHQLVCHQYGKQAITKYEVINIKDSQTLVYFYPKTGRTHQLRVHAAHQEGLNSPIIGDDLYGQKANRLHLHASRIEFSHPTKKKLVVFESKPEFIK